MRLDFDEKEETLHDQGQRDQGGECEQETKRPGISDSPNKKRQQTRFHKTNRHRTTKYHYQEVTLRALVRPGSFLTRSWIVFSCYPLKTCQLFPCALKTFSESLSEWIKPEFIQNRSGEVVWQDHSET